MTQESDDGWRGFLSLCSKARSPEMLDELFGLFLTAAEREGMATRFTIVRELIRSKKTQREIAKDLKVSIAKITRGSNSLKIISKDLRRLLDTVF